MPSDDITVFYKTSGNLERIIPDYYDFIFATIKQPLQPFTGSPPSGSGISFIVSDNAKVILSAFLLILIPKHRLIIGLTYAITHANKKQQQSLFCKSI